MKFVVTNNYTTLPSRSDIKDVSKWTNRDFLIYFSQKYGEITGTQFKIPPQAWMGFMSRMKGFRSKLNLDNERYKDFIDTIFAKFFTKEKYVPTFGAVVSEKVFFVSQRINKESKCTATDFATLQNQLYSNNELFKHIV